MRGLPRPPAGVFLWKAHFSIDTLQASFGQWIAIPGGELATPAELLTVVSSLLFYFQDFTAQLTHQGCRLVRVDLIRWGSLPLTLAFPVAENHGAWLGGQVATACTVVHWLSGRGGKGFDSLTFVPGFPDEFTDDHARLNGTGLSNVQSRGASWLDGVAAVPGISGGHCVHGSVHRVSAGAPLGVATFTPTIGVRPGPLIGTLDRRRNVAR